ncbi:hypothetical protein D3C75_1081370 [compost metagenome]
MNGQIAFTGTGHGLLQLDNRIYNIPRSEEIGHQQGDQYEGYNNDQCRVADFRCRGHIILDIGGSGHYPVPRRLEGHIFMYAFIGVEAVGGLAAFHDLDEGIQFLVTVAVQRLVQNFALVRMIDNQARPVGHVSISAVTNLDLRYR